jgi:hypothetical protein
VQTGRIWHNTPTLSRAFRRLHAGNVSYNSKFYVLVLMDLLSEEEFLATGGSITEKAYRSTDMSPT